MRKLIAVKPIEYTGQELVENFLRSVRTDWFINEKSPLYNLEAVARSYLYDWAKGEDLNSSGSQVLAQIRAKFETYLKDYRELK